MIVDVPPGSESGRQRGRAGQGEAGPVGNGGALVTIDIRPHPFFQREGDDVRLELPVRLDEAVLGAKVKVPTVEGAVMLTVPAGSPSGRTLRLKGKGFHGTRVRMSQDVRMLREDCTSHCLSRRSAHHRS